VAGRSGVSTGRRREVKSKTHGSRMALGVAIAAIAILLLTVFPVMAQDTAEAGSRDLVWLVLVCSILALLFCVYLVASILRKDEGTDKMKEIAAAVRVGARAYLKRQYMAVAVFFVVAFIILMLLAWGKYLRWPVPFAFLRGGIFSGLCGYIGMTLATRASARTANAARESLNSGLRVAFSSGAVMGLVVVGLALLDLSVWYYTLRYWLDYSVHETATVMVTFGMGASSMALFARVGGGIFTKAADVGADLVGKVEAGIPEDDPRNPAVIADNVGDNVGDVAGMGADLYESYVGSIVATMALGGAAFVSLGLDLGSVTAPLLIAASGIIASIIGTFFVRAGEKADQGVLLRALRTGIYISAFLVAVASFFIVRYTLGMKYIGVWGSVMSGLIVGQIIGYSTEYFTSAKYRPTRFISDQAETGPATVIIAGLSIGMLSTLVPVVTICFGIFFSFYFAGGFSNAIMGLYGVGIAAVGMLSTLGITLATDAYGPVADNAGGNAEMAGLPPEVREKTDALDSLGNTTAATGKGFAIGSAALTALALISAYKQEVLNVIQRMGKATSFDISLDNPKLLIGLFLGGLMPFLFGALTMQAVGKAAGKIVMEVRRQFREIKGLMEGTGTPDYASCVNISTSAAQKQMIVPSLLALVMPVVVGLVLGVEAVVGLLVGGLVCGFVLAVMMANAGGAWDNAKKYIETGAHGGKGSDPHKASVVGDTVGDPFKDTSGPSLNILIKLMSMVSLVFVAFVVKNALF
jgi:K(+)-stimulated pyrophosphate-energized sodium pump